MKTEPDTFGLDDLKTRGTEPWTGVRNFMARNHMRHMEVGDVVLFYHSNAEPSGVAGIARVCAVHKVDETQFDPESPYFDERATRDKPRWDCVDVEYVSHFTNFVPLERLKHEPTLKKMLVVQKGMRLSVMPVDEKHFHHVVAMSEVDWIPPKKKVKKVIPTKKKKARR
jgi:predicted RNA-binding protein with PUA-like domain